MEVYVHEAVHDDRALLSHVGERPERVEVDPLRSILKGPALLLHEPLHHEVVVVNGAAIIGHTDQGIIEAVVCQERYLVIAVLKEPLLRVHAFFSSLYSQVLFPKI